MEVLGSLVVMDSECSLPLPWWHRAPMGFLDKTSIHIAVIGNEGSNRPVGDLILSVLNPNKWEYMLRVECSGKDEPGLISKVFDSVYPLNIAIAETVTPETGKMHHITLICEPKDIDSDRISPTDLIQRETDRITRNLELHGIITPKIKPFIKNAPTVLWSCSAVIEHGWINNIFWKKKMGEIFPYTEHGIDFSRAVISADTTKRLMRYIFPESGAVLIEVLHADDPGVLRAITDAIGKCKLNILSSFLRRGGVHRDNAVLVAVCESAMRKTMPELKGLLEIQLKKLPPKFQITLTKFTDGEKTKSMIHQRHPDDFVVKIPKDISLEMEKYNCEVPKKRIPIFISRRFVDKANERHKQIVHTLEIALKDHNCHPIEAYPKEGKDESSRKQVMSKMWLSKAAIVLVASNEPENSFSANLAHEAGFFMGQGKPVLILIQEKNVRDIKGFSNSVDYVMPRFPNDDRAFDPSNENSIYQIISRWWNNIEKDLIK